jgi:type IV secretion system protein VirB11
MARHHESLVRELGDFIVGALANADITEIMLNPDGELWVDSRTRGLARAGAEMPAHQAESLLSTVAGLLDRIINEENPILEAELPLDGSRIEGLLPPVVPSPVFAIRKRPTRVFTLDDYIADRILTADQADILRGAIVDRQNLLISGGPGSGKTTFANAVLREMDWLAPRAERYLLIEDTYELQCKSPNHVTLHTTENVSLRDLVRAAIRLRPDRIVIGEVRGEEALDLLKAWNTGNPGGCATVHANSAVDALSRLDQLAQEAGVPSQARLVASTVDLVAHMERSGSSRRVRELVSVHGLTAAGEYHVEPIAEPPAEKENPE